MGRLVVIEAVAVIAGIGLLVYLAWPIPDNFRNVDWFNLLFWGITLGFFYLSSIKNRRK